MASTAETVLNYLKEQNRPYNVTDIFNNLHKAIKRAILQRNLDSLVESGQIVVKTYGQQKIYYAPQKDAVAPTDVDLAAMDREIEALKQQVQSRTTLLKELETQLGALNSKMSPDDCRREIENFKNLNGELEKRIKVLEGRGQCKVDPADREALVKQRDLLSRESKERQKICKEAVQILLDNLPIGKAELYDELGLEMD